jgi:hypothetical protein
MMLTFEMSKVNTLLIKIKEINQDYFLNLLIILVKLIQKNHQGRITI